MAGYQEKIEAGNNMVIGFFAGLFWILQTGLYMRNRVNSKYVDGSF
jgi:hypothetical protein